MMTYTYKKLKTMEGADSTTTILRKEDNAFIPCDEENCDYQAYLEWAKTNTPEAAD